jgi:hypothetical protein
MTLASLAAISGPNPFPFALVFDSLWYCRLAEGRLKAEEAFREAVANERKKADEQFQKVSTRDTLERGGPYCLRQMGTEEVHMKGVLP